jgi:CDP-diacylglycerol--glycerol-3-phosphate 3-phosphatidyltransferase
MKSEHFAFLAFLAVLAIGLVSMPVYALVGPRRDRDQEGKGGQFMGGAGAFPLHWFMWAISPLLNASLRLGLTADFYNYAGLALGLGSGALIATGRLELGGWALVLSGVADILDGRIARFTGVASDFGDFIDSTFDRFAEAATFVGLALYLRTTPYGAVLAGAALAGALTVSYARARGEVSGVVCTRGLMQRGERLALTALLCFLAEPLGGSLRIAPAGIIQPTLALIALTTWVTAVYRTAWIAARLRRSSPSESPDPREGA